MVATGRWCQSEGLKRLRRGKGEWMDPRRLDTEQALAAGIINIPLPETDIPEDREDVSYDIYEPMSADELIKALDEGKVVSCPEYYGIPNIWREAEDDYRGTLLQYRSVSEAPQFATAEDAVEWFITTAAAVAG